ncbi:hypothetical protein AURDEDRAFT_179026 [Auricularia subglabra TFB-10046 SS5]|nr:hypothetical protein AURDEDRAFT_179026 [Auricularia subglabra TFB-10046 SS5]
MYADPAHSASGEHIQQAPDTPGSSSSRDAGSKHKTELTPELIARLELLPDPTRDEPPTMQYSNCWIAYRTAFVNIVKAHLPEAQKAQMQCTSEAARRYKKLTVAQKKAWTEYALRSKQLHQANPNSRGAKRRRIVEQAASLQLGSPFTSAPVPLPVPADADAERVASSGKAPRAKPSKGSRSSPIADSRPASEHGDAAARVPPPPLYIPPASIHAPSPVSAGSQPGWEARIDPALSMLSSGENDSQCGSSRHSPATPANYAASQFLAAASIPQQQQQHAMNWAHSLSAPLALPQSASPVPMQESQNYMYPAIGGAAAWPIPPYAGQPQFTSALPSDLRYAQLAPLSDRTTGEGYGTQQPQQSSATQNQSAAAPPQSGSSQQFTDYGYEYEYAQYATIEANSSVTLGLTINFSNAGSGTPSPERDTLPEMQHEAMQPALQLDIAYVGNYDPMDAYVYALAAPEYLYSFDSAAYQ